MKNIQKERAGRGSREGMLSRSIKAWGAQSNNQSLVGGRKGDQNN